MEPKGKPPTIFSTYSTPLPRNSRETNPSTQHPSKNSKLNPLSFRAEPIQELRFLEWMRVTSFKTSHRPRRDLFWQKGVDPNEARLASHNVSCCPWIFQDIMLTYSQRISCVCSYISIIPSASKENNWFVDSISMSSERWQKKIFITSFVDAEYAGHKDERKESSARRFLTIHNLKWRFANANESFFKSELYFSVFNRIKRMLWFDFMVVPL